MRFRFALGCAAMASLAVTATTEAHARDAVTLEASSRWNMRYDADKCRLARTFGQGENEVVLQIDQSGIEPFYTVSVFGGPLRSARGQIMSIQFGPDEAAAERSFIEGKLKENGLPFVIMHGVELAPLPSGEREGEFATNEIGPEREQAIDRIVFDKGLRDPVILATGSLGKPLEAMRTCSVDLVETLGLTEEAQGGITEQVKPDNLDEFVRILTANYPARMLDREEEGAVTFRVVVDRTGKPASCQVARSTRPAVFDDTVCFAVMRHAKFSPARDENGDPIYSTYSTSVRYIMSD